MDNSPEGRERALARARKRWPGDGDWQCSIALNPIEVNRLKLTLMDIATIVFSKGYLDTSDYEALDQVHPDLGSPNSVVLNTWINRPWQPNRRRIWGFGRVTSDRSCTHDVVNPISMIHYAWNFLTPQDRRQAMKAIPKWRKYADLRRIACSLSVAPLKQERMLEADGSVPVALDPARALMNSCGLLRFDFSHGDFIRFLGGEFTNEHRDFNAEWDVIERNLENADPPSDMPPTKLDMAYRIQTEGVPLRGNFETPSAALPVRNAYDNHPAVHENLDEIEKKFAKEEWRNYHIHYKRFVYDYIPGLVINPIQWAFDKGKGRICIDCSKGPYPSGSINLYIPKPGEGHEDECPDVYYQHAFDRFLRHIMRMRITRPDEPIMVHADDIDAAFRRVLYHPDMAIAFAYVYRDYLMVPVGQVFGSRSAPSYYCCLADLRQALAACRPPDPELHPLVASCDYYVRTDASFARIPPDSHHPALTPAEQERMYNASFVDDNGVVSYLKTMPQALQASVMSAFEVFGDDKKDRRGPCLQQDKWIPLVSETFQFLGFKIDTRSMTVAWPFYKRKALYEELQEILKRKPKYVTPKEMAHIVGVIRSASSIAPWGTFLSFNLQNALNNAARHAFSTGRTWWTRAWIYLSKVAIATIHQLLETLLEPEDSILWSRPIALYLERDFSHRIYSDASYGGIGGWSPDFGFLWRLCRDDLVRAGFKMKDLNLRTTEPMAPDAEGLHINPLEFIGVIVNLWITIKFIRRAGPRAGGYILALLADNTSALSWMSLASRTKDPLLQGLARLASALLVEAAKLLTKVVPKHLAGDLNFVADALSRPPTAEKPNQNILDCVISEWSQLDGCRICLIPFSLLSEIASLISSQSTAVRYDLITINLLNLELDILPIGVRTWDSPSTIWEA